MKPNQFSEELKKQVVEECQRTGNIALVARRYEISDKMVYNRIAKSRKQGYLQPLPKIKSNVPSNWKGG